MENVPMGPPLQLELSKRALGPFALALQAERGFELLPVHRRDRDGLSSTIFNVLDYLRTAGKDSFPWVQIKFDPESPATSPIYIHLLPLPGTLLVFPSPSQRLTQIHVLSLPSPNLTLVYSTQVLASPAKPLTRGDVNRVFGPTFDGGESGEIWYPGLGFGFDESSSSSSGGKDRSQGVKRVHICQKEEMGSSIEAVKVKQASDGLAKAVIQPTRRSLQLQFLSSPPLSITLNETTVSDLIAELGPPIRTFYKEDTRMAIHSDNAGASEEEEGSYFQNYVHLGCDFLISGRSHKVCKIILHSNLPGAMQFGRYERCPWEFEGDEQSDPPSPPLSVTTRASLLLASISTATTTPSPPSSDWPNTVLRAFTNPSAQANPSSLPLPTSPSPTPSPPPGTSEKKKKKNSKREQPPSQSTSSSLSVPTPAATPAVAVAPRGPTGTGGLEMMKGMVLDRAGEGWGKGVILESTRLVAATESLAFEVLGGGPGGSGGDVETVMMF